MWHCIAGILLCGSSANIVVPGPLGYAPPAMTGASWAYATMTAPILSRPQPLYLVAYGRR